MRRRGAYVAMMRGAWRAKRRAGLFDMSVCISLFSALWLKQARRSEFGRG